MRVRRLQARVALAEMYEEDQETSALFRALAGLPRDGEVYFEVQPDGMIEVGYGGDWSQEDWIAARGER